jgi:hypothetical protein
MPTLTCVKAAEADDEIEVSAELLDVLTAPVEVRETQKNEAVGEESDAVRLESLQKPIPSVPIPYVKEKIPSMELTLNRDALKTGTEHITRCCHSG